MSEGKVDLKRCYASKRLCLAKQADYINKYTVIENANMEIEKIYSERIFEREQHEKTYRRTGWYDRSRNTRVKSLVKIWLIKMIESD